MPSQALSLWIAEVILVTLLYGSFIVLTIVSWGFWWLSMSKESELLESEHLRSRSRPWSRFLRRFSTNPICMFSLMLFWTVTAYWALSMVRLYQSCTHLERTGSVTAYLFDVSNPVFCASKVLMFLACIICDGLLIYRLWVIWGRKYYMIILPVITLIGLAVGAVWSTYLFARSSPGSMVYGAQPVILAAMEITALFVTNLYCTGLIAWRIWRGYNQTAGYVPKSSTLMTAFSIFIESALLYTPWSILAAVSYLAKLPWANLAVDNMPLMAAISFSLINTRVGMERIAKHAERQQAMGGQNVSALIFARPLATLQAQSTVSDATGFSLGDTVDDHLRLNMKRKLSASGETSG